MIVIHISSEIVFIDALFDHSCLSFKAQNNKSISLLDLDTRYILLLSSLLCHYASLDCNLLLNLTETKLHICRTYQ